jgi:hypothetical protein
MPDELVQFLKDAGPLKKKGEDERKQGATFHPRSTRDASSAPLTNNDESPANAAPKTRRREFMPLASNVEGFSTERTTNFSYDDDSPSESATRTDEERGLYDVVGLYRIIAAKGDPPDPNLDETIQQWIRDAQQYLEVPVIVKESDEDGYIGVHPQKLDELRIDPVPKTIVKLIVEDLAESRDKDKAR